MKKKLITMAFLIVILILGISINSNAATYTWHAYYSWTRATYKERTSKTNSGTITGFGASSKAISSSNSSYIDTVTISKKADSYKYTVSGSQMGLSRGMTNSSISRIKEAYRGVYCFEHGSSWKNSSGMSILGRIRFTESYVIVDNSKTNKRYTISYKDITNGYFMSYIMTKAVSTYDTSATWYNIVQWILGCDDYDESGYVSGFLNSLYKQTRC